MSQEIADRVHHDSIRTIAINTTFRLAPWADMLYAADAYWWLKYEKEVLSSFPGMKVTCSANGIEIPWVHTLRNTGKVTFDDDPGCVRTGGNSGYQAIHVAAHAGAKRILLCGFNMRGGHWHGRHPEPLRNAGEAIYDRWLKYFVALSDELRRRGIQVLNCTPNSAITVWPKVELEVALEETLSMPA